MIIVAAFLALLVAAGGPAPARRHRGPALARHLVAAAFDDDRAWRYSILAPVRLHNEMERARDELLIEAAHRAVWRVAS